MEDFEHRRERLKAMRLLAAEAETSNIVGTSTIQSSGLANPLLDTPATLTGQEECPFTPRFDFYTDPMAAFTGNKKRSVAGNQVTQGFFTPSNSGTAAPHFSSPHTGPRPEMIPFPDHQMQSNHSTNHRMYQAHGPYQSSFPYRRPSGIQGHFPTHQGTIPAGWSRPVGTPSYYNSEPHGGNTCPYTMHQGDPRFGAVGSSSLKYGQGRAHWPGISPSPGSGCGGNQTPGLGRRQWQQHGGRMSPGIGRNGGRGQVFRHRGYVPDETLGPESFYHESMIEDPWQHLEPVLWRGLDAPCSSNSWLPESISMKKPRVSEPANKSSSQQSLAEYLAASFSEAVNDASNV